MSGQEGSSPAALPGSGRAPLDEAVEDLRRARLLLLSVSDPRQPGAYLEAMRSCITDIAEIAGDAASSIPPPCADAGDVQAICRGALTDVDQLLAGIADAARYSQRHAGWDREAFTASRAVIRQLLTDRAAVDASSHELLRAVAGYLSQAHPTPGKEAPPS